MQNKISWTAGCCFSAPDFVSCSYQDPSDILTLENKGELGECRRECNTIAHACRAPALFQSCSCVCYSRIFATYCIAAKGAILVIRLCALWMLGQDISTRAS